MRQIALIGGSGFIGRHIAQQLTSQDPRLVIGTRRGTDDARLAELVRFAGQCSRLAYVKALYGTSRYGPS